ncbi:DEgenerin Like [Aphelenchoides besseyi]|nr:DEgenerin Like [Aphelenchoides besseyi]
MKLSSFQRGILDILRDFGQWTSTHAVPHIAMADALWIAVFWTVVFIVALALTIYQVYTLIKNFVSYPVVLNARLEYGTSNFPCISFCSANPWKLSEVAGTPLDGLVQAYNLQQTNDQYGFEAPFTMRESIRAARWTKLMFEDLVALDEAGTINLGYTLNDLVISCSFVNEDCDMRAFESYYDATYGHCHIFNPNGTLKTPRAGPNYGLRLTLRSITNNYLPWTQTAGIVFSVHGANGSSFEDALGYFAANGRATSAGVKYYFRDKLSHPYNDCVENGDGLVNYYGDVYEIESCLRSCMQDAMIRKCKCYDPQFARASNGTATSCYKVADINEAIDCADEITNTANLNNSVFNIQSDCKCPFPCNQSYYQVSMSLAGWPAKTYVPIECLNSSTKWSNLKDCRAWYSKNTVLIEIYYERMNREEDIESAGYPLFNLIADVGGQLGLWLGMSVVSIFEFFLLIVLLIMYAVIRPKRATLEGYDYWKEFEKQIEENRKDNDPDLIYGDSDQEDGPSMPPKVQEPIPTQKVTDLSVANPVVENPTPAVLKPTTSNLQVEKPQAANPQAANPQAANPQVANPQAANPQAANPQPTPIQTAKEQTKPEDASPPTVTTPVPTVAAIEPSAAQVSANQPKQKQE